ncbi:MAG: anti-sigma factor [Gammaproteobacteria bacterium]|nr:anti-sigma factor [Gammaproteobacteria bacterium]MAY01917.1 anti-sigma factor [Gammaproteobacteria bacterium]|tara:strand:+ start:1981 stop:2208 length:228 start_codon:yes stop_codon:yes gene_type:complete
MLKCKEVAAKASDYIDSELSRGQAFSMALHLLMCGNCRRFVKYFRLSLLGIPSGNELSADQAESLSTQVISKASE